VLDDVRAHDGHADRTAAGAARSFAFVHGARCTQRSGVASFGTVKPVRTVETVILAPRAQTRSEVVAACQRARARVSYHIEVQICMGSGTQLGTTSVVAGNGGIARLARLMAKALAASDADADVLALMDSKPAADVGLPVKVTHSSKARFVVAVHRAALNHRRFIYDFAGTARAHPRWGPLRRPFAVWMCGIEVWEAARPDRLRALRSADLLLSISAFTRDRASSLHAGLDHARVCWLGTEQDELPDVARQDGPPVVLIVARMDPDGYKGHTELLQAWPKVVSAVPDARLVMAGGGERLEHIRDVSRRSPVAQNIDVLGFVPEDVIARLWASARVFAMPSRGDGFGFVYIEAMRHGLPIVASVHDAGAEVNADGVTGYNVDLERREHLADALIHLLRDEATAARFGTQSRARWQEHFRFSVFQKRFLQSLGDFMS
jgi:phosphatidylinositol alpha-1,6-mannosyltransferase